MRRIAYSFAFLSLLSAAARAGSLDIHIELSPAGSFTSSSDKVKGEARKAGANYTANNVVLKLNDLKSGIDLRDNHMKEKYFETKKFPDAVLKEATGSDGKFEGKLALHGVEKGISGTYEVSGSRLDAKFKTTLSDFSIPKANYKGVGVEDEVEVEVHLPIASGN